LQVPGVLGMAKTSHYLQTPLVQTPTDRTLGKTSEANQAVGPDDVPGSIRRDIEIFCHIAREALGERGREMLDKETKNGSKIKETGLQAVLKRRV